MHAVVTNSTVDGVLAAFFAILVVIVIVDAARICVKAIRARELLPTTEVPAEESQLRAPTGCSPARRERSSGGSRDGPRSVQRRALVPARGLGRDRVRPLRRASPARAPGRAGDVPPRLRAPPPGRPRGPATGALLLKISAASPFAAVERSRWRGLGGGGDPLGYDELVGLSGLGEPVARRRGRDVYIPLARLLELRIEAARELSGRAGRVPRRAGPRRPVPDRPRRQRGRGQVHGGAAGRAGAAAPAARLARGARDHGRLPAAQRGVDREGHPRPQGLPGVLRPARAAALRRRPQERGGGGHAPVYSHLRYDTPDETLVVPPDVVVLEGVNVLKRGSRRASTCPTSSTSRSTSTPRRTTSAAGTWSGSWSCAAARSRTRSRTSTATRSSPTRRRSRSRGHLGAHQPPNLLENIQPTRPRADVILEKGGDHFVSRILCAAR